MNTIKTYQQYNEEWLSMFNKNSEITKKDIEESEHFNISDKSHPDYVRAINFVLSNMKTQGFKSDKRVDVIKEIAIFVNRVFKNYRHITDNVLSDEYNKSLTPKALRY